MLNTIIAIQNKTNNLKFSCVFTEKYEKIFRDSEKFSENSKISGSGTLKNFRETENPENWKNSKQTSY